MHTLWPIAFLCSALMLAILCVRLCLMRRSRKIVSSAPSSGSSKAFSEHGVLISKLQQNILPPGYSREFDAGLFQLNQVISAAVEGLPNAQGLYSVTFAPDTLAALRSGDAALMHGLGGDRAVAVSVDGKKIRGIGIVTDNSFEIGRVCFATASFLTGQYFLTRIDKKLNTILITTQETFKLLDSTERAKLASAADHLKAVIASGTHRKCTDNDLARRRHDHWQCIEIATRAHTVLQDDLAQPTRREVLGPMEWIADKTSTTTRWIDNQISKLIPSRREDRLLENSRKFADIIIRGINALQISLCFEALMEQESSSSTSVQICSLVDRYESVLMEYRTHLHKEKDTALADYRYIDAGRKRERLLQEFASLLNHIDQQWDTLKEMADLWRRRFREFPEAMYVAVNEAGQCSRFYLPG